MNLEQQQALILMAGPSGIISVEASEQKSLTRGFNRLPKDGPRYVAEKMGFIFGEVVDDLFLSATAPEGWSIVPHVDHNMWSDIKDEKGNIRGSVFYKGVFYDRCAFYHLYARYIIRKIYEPEPEQVEKEVECWFDVSDRYNEFEVSYATVVAERKKFDFATFDYYEDVVYRRIEDQKIRSFKKKKVKRSVYVTEPKPWAERTTTNTILDRASGETLFSAGPILNGLTRISDSTASICLTWLKDNFPEYENELAYW